MGIGKWQVRAKLECACGATKEVSVIPLAVGDFTWTDADSPMAHRWHHTSCSDETPICVQCAWPKLLAGAPIGGFP